MGFRNLGIEDDGAIRTIVVNRPEKLNALNQETIAELREAFEAAAREDAVRVVVLTGAGSKAFIAGADIGELNTATPVQALGFSRRGQALMTRVERLGKPLAQMEREKPFW